MVRRTAKVLLSFAVSIISWAFGFAQTSGQPPQASEPPLKEYMWVALNPGTVLKRESDSSAVVAPTYPKVYQIKHIDTDSNGRIKYHVHGYANWTSVRNVLIGDVPADRVIGPHESHRELTEMIQKDPYNAELYDSRGLVAKGLSRSPEALRDFEKSLQLNPNSSATYMNRAMAYYRVSEIDWMRYRSLDARSVALLESIGSSKLQRAFADITEAIRIDPDGEIFYQLRADISYDLKYYSRCIEDSIRVLRNDLTNYESIIQRAYVFYHLDENYLAIDDFTLALELLDKRLEKSKSENRASNPAERITWLENARLDTLLGRAACYQDLQRQMKSDHDVSSALAIPLTYPKDLLYRAKKLTSLGKATEAIVDFEKVLALEPGNAEARRGRAGANRKLKKYAEAAKDMESILAEKESSDDYLILAAIHKEAKDFQAAIDVYTIVLDPDEWDEPSVKVFLARAKAYDKLYQTHPTDAATDQNLQKAIADLTDALALDPENIDVLLYRAKLLFQQGAIDDAKADYNAILAIEPANVRAKLGLSLMKRKTVSKTPAPAKRAPSASEKQLAATEEQTKQEEAITKLETARAASEQARLSAAIAVEARKTAATKTATPADPPKVKPPANDPKPAPKTKD